MKRSILFLCLFASVGILVQVVRFYPDGKLHIVFCDVGQGDAAYIRFPNSVDMLIDGGPDGKVLNCLGNAMPFYDRTIDIVLMTHPQADHMNGLVEVLKRYHVGTFITPPVGNNTSGYQNLLTILKKNEVPIRNGYAGTDITVGEVSLQLIWPDRTWVAGQLANRHCIWTQTICLASETGEDVATVVQRAKGMVLGATTDLDLNLFSSIFILNYGHFNALFTGDADEKAQTELMKERNITQVLSRQHIEVLKYPHHGSKTGILEPFFQLVKPKVAIIEVGARNRYGHPSPQALNLLARFGVDVNRTDQNGSIEIVTDGKIWRRTTSKGKQKKTSYIAF